MTEIDEEIIALKSEIVRLREALEYYSNVWEQNCYGAFPEGSRPAQNALNASPEAINLYHEYVQAAVALAEAMTFFLPSTNIINLFMIKPKIRQYEEAKKAWEEVQRG